jgi:hypothetical protein
MIKLQAAWGGFLLGCVAGAITGLFFHNSDWLGGYATESPGLRAVSGSLADRLRGYVHGYRQKSG